MLVGIFGLVLVSCEDDYDQSYPDANKPTASISPLIIDAAEGETVTFTVTMDALLDEAANFKLEALEAESQAEESLDYIVPGLEVYPEFDFGQAGYKIDMPALQTVFTFDVVVTEDILADSGEKAVLRFNAAGNDLSDVAGGEQKITINIANTESFNGATSTDLGLKLDWSGIVSFPYLETDPNTGEVTQEFQQNFDLAALDFDVILEYPDGSAIYFAATGDCPEINVLPATEPDGTYTVYVDYYDDADQETVSAPVPIPMIMTVSNIGATDGSTIYADTFDISSPVSADEGGTPVAFATIEKSGSSYTVTNLITGEVFYP